MCKNNNPNGKTSASQTRRILAYLQDGGKICHKMAEKLFDCSRLGARIKDIERIVGYKPPRKLTEVHGFDADGNPVKKHVMFYWLWPDGGERED